MIKIIFVCTGNICRSPMAEAIMMDLIKKENLTSLFKIDSAGLISFHEGEYADHRTRKVLAEHGIVYYGHARQVREKDFKSDYIIPMTQDQLQELVYLKPDWSNTKMHLLLEFCQETDQIEVLDPYYQGGFEEAYVHVKAGCQALLTHIKENELKEPTKAAKAETTSEV